MNKEEKVPIYCIVSKALKNELDSIALREDRFVKELLSEIISEYCKAHKEGNNQHLILNWMESGANFIGFPSIAITLEKKKEYIKNNLAEDNRLNPLGKELWNHICEWYGALNKL